MVSWIPSAACRLLHKRGLTSEGGFKDFESDQRNQHYRNVKQVYWSHLER